jgi:(p)ppGpp synthase/HD superfamily hydrolase
MSSSWKPSVVTNSDCKFNNLPQKMEYTWNKKKTERIIGNKRYTHSDKNFPTLGSITNSEETTKMSSIDTSAKPPQSSNWIDYVKTKSEVVEIKNIIVEEEVNTKKWTNEDSLDEYFDLLHMDTILDINDAIIEYCNEKHLPYYDSYDKLYNLVELVKYTSTEYSNMFNEKGNNDGDENEDEYEMEEEFIY